MATGSTSVPLIEDLLEPCELGTVGIDEVARLGRRYDGEAKWLGSKVFVLTALTCMAVYFATPGVRRSPWYFYGARATVAVALCLEFFRGYLHFMFPYSSHLVFSGMADNVGVRSNPAALGFVAIVTHQFGAANLLLGAMYAVPFLYPDPYHRLLLYTCSVTCAVRAIQNYQQHCGCFRFFRAALPKWLTGGDAETRKKAPPGKTVQDIQAITQVLGLFMATAAWWWAPPL
mmetsp:Transcript_30211/g.83094  ORF Transcript_30211/g.83094 Transcript_30211/m.83094 type:complete len:231 (-) Transcript_30211:183-875(-)